MFEEQLFRVAEDIYSLTDLAREQLKTEFERRGLNLPEVAPPANPEPEAKVITIANFQDRFEAQMAQGLLDSAGIKNFLTHEDSAFSPNTIGDISLQVREEDAIAAKELLDQPVGEELSGQEQTANDRPEDGVFSEQNIQSSYHPSQCPICHSPDITFEPSNATIAFAATLLFDLPITTRADSWSCNACGSRWQGPTK
jgi:Putative prokaryotic signal transducing protein